MKILLKILILIFFFVLAAVFGLWHFFGPAGESNEVKVFTIPEEAKDFQLAKELKDQNLIKNDQAFQFLWDNFSKGKEIQSGGYHLRQNMNSWEVLQKITGKPDLLWVAIYGCQRKEQIGETLAEILGWDKSQLDLWDNIYNKLQPEYFEGVYFPDTYLIPVEEPVDLVAQRFINRFNEAFAPLADQFLAKNIKWTTGLKIASLIAREAGGKEDMPIISGIIWNRLEQSMPLQIDATMQYTLGKNSQGKWWGTIDLSQKEKDSPYNSYLYKGLPPTPICSPGLDAIEAVLNPVQTDCLFYLHDKEKLIHCAKTYAEHKKNIAKYL